MAGIIRRHIEPRTLWILGRAAGQRPADEPRPRPRDSGAPLEFARCRRTSTGAPPPTSFCGCWRSRAAASSRSTSATPPASARPTRCSRTRTRCASRASTSSSASSRRTAAPRPRRGCTASSSFRAASSRTRARSSRRWTCPAILARKPEVVLVDELAHTNVPGAENPKRYEDVEDLLEAGISVMTAVNIQHFESVQDIVSRVTGVDVQERVPDRLLRQADALVNVDLPSEELRERLKAGKIYPADRIGPALAELLHRGEPRVAARARDAPDRRPPRGRAPRPATAPCRASPSAPRPWSRCRRTPTPRACCCAAPRRSPASSTPTGSPSTSARRRKTRGASRRASTAS